jgi:hypothetical protein
MPCLLLNFPRIASKSEVNAAATGLLALSIIVVNPRCHLGVFSPNYGTLKRTIRSKIQDDTIAPPQRPYLAACLQRRCKVNFASTRVLRCASLLKNSDIDDRKRKMQQPPFRLGKASWGARMSIVFLFLAVVTPVTPFQSAFTHMRAKRAPAGLCSLSATTTEKWRGPGNPFKKIEVYKPSFGDGT